MAQNVRLAALTDELVHSILKFDPDANKLAYKHAKDIAIRGLRAHQYVRTNQFDVQASFGGLDEKFRVLNRDDLADALGKRVQEINRRHSKWIPEYLSLLLQLSDRPTENSKVEALELLRPPTPPPPLTWKQILEEAPYSDDEIWKDIDYGVESSEDEKPSKRRTKEEPSPSSSVEEDETYDPEACCADVDKNLITNLGAAQFWRHELQVEQETVEMTELQAVRETLFMLAGLPTSLYYTDKHSSSIRVMQKYVIAHAIQGTADHLLSELADMGRVLCRLRQWTKRPSPLPLIQTFEAAIKNKLLQFDQYLALLQRRYLVPEAPIAVSLLGLLDEVRSVSRPILRLARIVADIEPQLLVNPFIHLETLFDQITLSQMTLEKDVFDFLSEIFFQCLQTYLKPIRKWMEVGELGTNDEIFFVFESDASSEMSSLWHDRFVLRRGKGNALRSPSFFHPATQRIFNTGKSVVFLKELGVSNDVWSAREPEPRLDHASVCGTSSDVPISPFPDLFQASFLSWIKSKYSLAATVLREQLFTQYSLMDILHNFRLLYLGGNGSLFQDFADDLFERIDRGQRGWNDRFLLTELARGVFRASLGGSHSDKIMVRSTRLKTHGHSVKGLGAVSLEYAVSWPIMNIIQRSSVAVYQQVFTFLLQMYRAKYLLQRVRLQDIHTTQDIQLRQLCYRLRHRLIWLVDILRSYVIETVIGHSTADMVAAMNRARDIDEMADTHMIYVARLQEQALLSENLRPIHKAVISLLDLSVLFSETHADSTHRDRPSDLAAGRDKRKIAPSKPTRRKSLIPAIVENDSSDSDGAYEKSDENSTAAKTSSLSSLEETFHMIQKDFEQLLSFVTAGLRNVGRVGAEPLWEMLAERLDWGTKKDRL